MNSSETFRVEGFDVINRNILFVSATNGNDRIGLWEFVVDRADFAELICRRLDTDVVGVCYHSNSRTYPDVVTGVI